MSEAAEARGPWPPFPDFEVVGNRTEAEIDNLLVMPQPPLQIFGPSATSVCVYVGLLKKRARNIGTSQKELQLKSFLSS